MDVMNYCADKSKRKEVHDFIKNKIDDYKNNNKLELSVNSLRVIEKLVDTQEKIIEEQEERIAIMSKSVWHPKDKPPKSDVSIDVWLVLNTSEEHNLVVLGCYWNGKYRNIRGHDISGWVTHWMEYCVPEPPKEGE